MKKTMYLMFVFFMCNAKESFFSKVIIWGHPLHSHTHSYIHQAFYRAFVHMGYEAYWATNLEDIKNIDLHNALFITEGQVDKDMPHREDCYYILHNCARDDYQDLFLNNRCITLQVYTHDCLPYVTEDLGDFIYTNMQDKIIYMPWATDLLPHEIDVFKQNQTRDKNKFTIYWIGTIGGGVFGNDKQIKQFKKACRENSVKLRQKINISIDETINLIRSSFMAPALQGTWQCEKGYIPCRIFKNISYGQWGITNNKVVYDLFDGEVVYNPDTYQLFYDAKAYIEEAPMSKLYALMDVVKNKHTYINRIETLLLFIKKALNIKEYDEI